MAVRLFEEVSHAAAYSKFRPVHPKQIFDKITNFTSKHGLSLDLVVDIACGSGQSTYQLAPISRQVIGTDISQAQIDCAKAQINSHSHSNVSFQVAPASKLPFSDNSVSMVTCANAWHWIDAHEVNPEIIRVLKRPGLVVIYRHMLVLPLISESKSRSIILDFHSNTLSGYWHHNHKNIDDYYQSDLLPFPLSHREDFEINSSISLDKYISFMSTWSGYQAYLKAHPETTVLNDLKDKLKQALVSNSDNIPIVTPYSILLCLNK